ncbi:MAG: hypothetical protein VW683_16970 [Betaproteobacteria bacterium]
MIIQHQAIYNLYPDAVGTSEDEGVYNYFDEAGNSYPVDPVTWQAEVDRLAQLEIDMEAARLSAIQKLATAAGLTADEQTAFFGGA